MVQTLQSRHKHEAALNSRIIKLKLGKGKKVVVITKLRNKIGRKGKKKKGKNREKGDSE